MLLLILNILYNCLADLFDCLRIRGVQFLDGTTEMFYDSLHYTKRVRIDEIDGHAGFTETSCATYTMQVGLEVSRAVLVDWQVKVDY